MDGADERGSTPLEHIDHLTRSPHRAQVIQLFAIDDWTRRELHEETGIPQPTLGRILGSFQDRGWLSRDEDTYSLTLRGRLIATQFEAILDAFETIQQLPADGDFEPILELGFDPQWLVRIDVTTSADGSDWYAHLRETRESVEMVDSAREIGPGPTPGLAELLVEPLRADKLTIETVFPREAFERFIGNSQDRSLVTEILRTGNAQLYLIDDPIRYYIARHGDRAVLDIPSTTGGPVTRLTTDQQAVLNWVDTTIDEFCRRADPVRRADLED